MRSMVCSGDRDMAMGSDRSYPLHNFNLPCLKWGNQRYLRCMKLGDASAAATATATATDESSSASVADRHRRSRFQRRRFPPSKFEGLMVGGMRRQESASSPTNDYGREQRLMIPKGETAEGIEAVREKIMKDLKTAADKIKYAIFRDEFSDGDEMVVDENEFKEPKQKWKDKEKDKEESPTVEVEVEARSWNLRTRRAACKAPIDGGETNSNHSSPTKNEVINSSRVRVRTPSVASATAADENKRARPKFSVPLSKKEIEEDFMMMVGRRPRKRPKKRARYVQRELDSLFPGLQLREVRVDSYKVPEVTENDNVS